MTGESVADAGAAGMDEAELNRRTAYLGLDSVDAERIRALQGLAAAGCDDFIDRFYADLARFPEPAAMLERAELSPAQIRALHRDQLLGLLGGKYDLDYARSRLRFGVRQHRAGLDPEWYIGAYRHYLDWLLPLAFELGAEDREKTLATVLSLIKVVLLDVELAARAYFRVDQERLRLLAKVFESDLEAVTIVDPQGRMVEANQMAASISGYPLADLIGHPIAKLHAPRNEQTFEALWAEVVVKGAWHGAIWHRHADGHDYLARMSMAAVQGKAGEVTHYIVEYSDATEAWEAEQALEARTEELKHSNRELEQFAYVASHDLQEPLRMVASYTQLLARRYQGKLDSDADEFIAFAVDGATRMQGLINDLLKFSRVGTRGKPFAPAEGGKLLADALANLDVAIKENGALITQEPLPRLLCDATQITQLFQNLIGNALKFRRPDVSPVIQVGVRRVAEGWEFSVRDNGIGISPEYFDRIFVIFQRLHSKAEYPGTGIGLALCRKIAERHGGRVWVDSRPGEGATFYFTVPDRKEGEHGH